MSSMRFTRRRFGAVLLAGSQASRLLAVTGPARIGGALGSAVEQRGIPCAVAIAAGADRILYSGGFGTRDAGSDIPVDGDTIFSIASMTKPITTVAAMQLVEQGKVTLDEPVARHLPQLANLQVLEGFDLAGDPVLRPAASPVTLRQLLTHTSGFAYPTWHEMMNRWAQRTGAIPPGAVAPLVPLMFDPGTHWQYGYSADWAGKLVEAVSGLTLEQYFQRNILQPLGMNDTSFLLPADKFDRYVGRYQRQADGELQAVPRAQPAPPREFNGGGGLYSTANDYVRFMQMILRYGKGGVREEILTARSVAEMSRNQIGNLVAGKLKSYQPNVSSDVDTNPGAEDRWGLGFLINETPHPGGRSAGSLAWAGIYNTFFWIDPQRRLAGVIMMQLLPFFDRQAVGLLDDFERAVYRYV